MVVECTVFFVFRNGVVIWVDGLGGGGVRGRVLGRESLRGAR